MVWPLQVPLPAPTQFWPNTYVGLATAFVVTVTAIGVIWTGFKHVNRLNGYGTRLNEATEKLAKMTEALNRLDLAVDRTLQSQSFLLTQIGEAKQSAANCDEEMQKYTVTIGSKVDEMRRAFEDWRSVHEKEMVALITELKTRKIIQ